MRYEAAPRVPSDCAVLLPAMSNITAASRGGVHALVHVPGHPQLGHIQASNLIVGGSTIAHRSPHDPRQNGRREPHPQYIGKDPDERCGQLPSTAKEKPLHGTRDTV